MSELSETAAIVQEDKPVGSARYWLGEIATAKRAHAPWHSRGDKVIRRYKDEGNAREMMQGAGGRGRKMAMLWSNVQTIGPALFNQTPVPNVSRRNKDADPVGRWGSIILERCIEVCLDTQDIEHTMRSVVQDLLLPGRGMAVVEYQAEIGDDPDAATEPGGDDPDDPTPQAGQKVTRQQAILRYVHWKDTLTNPARMWSEVWWFGYRSFLTREEIADKFGKDVAAKIQLDHKPDEGGKQTGTQEDNHQATVWTIWCKRHNKVYQVAPGYPDDLLSDMEPPCRFDNFWPIPRPVTATVGSDSIVPVPDFAMYQDQADEIDLLTNKIYKLSESLRLRGLYPADMDSVKRLLSDASDTELIPVENWAMLAERGGADGLVVWFPLKDVAAALVACYEAREKAKAALYEVTGIGDIVRGASDASETATAQQLKSQWGSLRIRDRQRDIQRFARDAIRLIAEVIAEHFSQETMAQMSGVKLLTAQQKQMLQMQQQYMQQYQQQAQQAQQMGQPVPPPPGIPEPSPEMLAAMKEPTWDEVMQLLRDDKLRGFHIDVETDSTIEPDQKAEQQKAVEFIGAMATFLKEAAPMVQMAPSSAPMLGEMLMFGARRFKIGETLETAIENFANQMAQQAQAPKPPDPTLEVAKVKADAEKQKAGAEVQMSQIDLQAKALEHQHAQAEHGMNMQALQMEGAAQQQAAALAQQQHEQAMQQAQQPVMP